MMSQVQNPDRQAPRDGLTRNVPRFLGDGVDGAEDGDIDALFENLDDDDDMRLPPAIDHDAMAASVARAAHKVIDPFAPSLHDDPLAAPEGESSTSRIRRPTVKLDEDRLLNHPDGMKKLITHAQTFKPGLKGSEKEDLKRVLKMYRMWAHVLYPKARFGDAVETIEKLCHKRALQSAMYEWREEAAGASRKKKKEAIEVPTTTETIENIQPDVRDDVALPSTSEPTSAPLFRAADDDQDEFGMDEEFDQLLQGMDVSVTATTKTSTVPQPLFAPDYDDEYAEEEALMREYEESHVPSKSIAKVAETSTQIPSKTSNLQTNLTIAPEKPNQTDRAGEHDWDDLYT